jgi:hypothetical protein
MTTGEAAGTALVINELTYTRRALRSNRHPSERWNGWAARGRIRPVIDLRRSLAHGREGGRALQGCALRRRKPATWRRQGCESEGLAREESGRAWTAIEECVVRERPDFCVIVAHDKQGV